MFTGAKFKQRSYDTHIAHIEEFKTLDYQVRNLLIGHSLFERFKTTPDLPNPYINNCFNAGCGGDTIPNLIYRLSFLELWNGLSCVDNIFIWIGCNDLKNKNNNINKITELYKQLFVIINHYFPNSKKYVFGISRKLDTNQDDINSINTELEKLCTQTDKYKYVYFNPREDELKDHVHFKDHVYNDLITFINFFVKK